MLVQSHQLIILVPVVMVHMFVLQILGGDILDGLPGLVIVMDILRDCVGVFVMPHLQGDVNFDVLLAHTVKAQRKGVLEVVLPELDTIYVHFSCIHSQTNTANDRQ